MNQSLAISLAMHITDDLIEMRINHDIYKNIIRDITQLCPADMHMDAEDLRLLLLGLS